MGQDSNKTGTMLAIGAALFLFLVVFVGGFVARFLLAQNEAQEAMEAFCDQVTVGMSIDEAKALASARDDVSFAGTGSGAQFDMVDGEFVCICSFAVQNGNVSSIPNVFCVD